MAKPDIERLSGEKVREYIFNEKYRSPADQGISDMIRRVARAVASAERTPELRERWEEKFFDTMNASLFTGAGRVMANAGTDRPKATLCNCYVVGEIPDSMDGIFSRLHESALIMQAGGGIGIDFSTLRPRGAAVKGTGSVSSGPVSFAQTWDAMCGTISAAGHRRGAQMGVMRVDHPDIDLFISAKKKDVAGENALKNFNLSVAVTDGFMEAVENDLDWSLVFEGEVYGTVRARELWDRIMKSNYMDWEPGVIFIDRVNHWNNLRHCEKISATNPCGEQPLPPFGSCNLGAIVLPGFIENPFLDLATFNFAKIEEAVRTAVRFLDNVVDINYYPLEKIKGKAVETRRMGLGIIGLTDALAMMKLAYGSDEGIEAARALMRRIRDAAYRASVELAEEKGPFPLFDREKFLVGNFVKTLPEDIREGIYRHGIRNSHLLTIAPTGTVSMFCGNMTSGIEPYFATDYERSIRVNAEGEKALFELSPYSVELYRRSNGGGPLPDYILESAGERVGYERHIRMQAALQEYIDASISKTVSFPESVSYEEFKEAYMLAYRLGCKGCTTYRPNNGKHGVIKAMAPEAGNGVNMGDDEALPEAPDVLSGRRYKVKLPDSKHAYYVNINDISENGRKRPFEVFINTKDPRHGEFMTALTRMISAVFRRSKNPSFVAEELKEIQSQGTAHFSPRRRKFIPSLVAEIGHVIQDHLVYLGLDEPVVPVEAYAGEANGELRPRYAYCGKCGEHTLVRNDACEFCINPECGYDRCG